MRLEYGYSMKPDEFCYIFCLPNLNQLLTVVNNKNKKQYDDLASLSSDHNRNEDRYHHIVNLT